MHLAVCTVALAGELQREEVVNSDGKRKVRAVERHLKLGVAGGG